MKTPFYIFSVDYFTVGTIDNNSALLLSGDVVRISDAELNFYAGQFYTMQSGAPFDIATLRGLGLTYVPGPTATAFLAPNGVATNGLTVIERSSGRQQYFRDTQILNDNLNFPQSLATQGNQGLVVSFNGVLMDMPALTPVGVVDQGGRTGTLFAINQGQGWLFSATWDDDGSPVAIDSSLGGSIYLSTDFSAGPSGTLFFTNFGGQLFGQFVIQANLKYNCDFATDANPVNAGFAGCTLTWTGANYEYAADWGDRWQTQTHAIAVTSDTGDAQLPQELEVSVGGQAVVQNTASVAQFVVSYYGILGPATVQPTLLNGSSVFRTS